MSGPVVAASKRTLPGSAVEEERVLRLVYYFSMKDSLQIHKSRMPVSRWYLQYLLCIPHVSKTFGHFLIAKSPTRLQQFVWEVKTRDDE